MQNKKKIILIILALVIIGGVFFIPRAVDYWNWQKTAKAISAMPWQDAGIITTVREPCVLDTPIGCPVPPPAGPGPCLLCGKSCPFASAVYGIGCPGYIELYTQSQKGTEVIIVPVGFKYSGGGEHPIMGMQYIAGGASDIMPWVIGIPGN